MLIEPILFIIGLVNGNRCGVNGDERCGNLARIHETPGCSNGTNRELRQTGSCANGV